MNRFRWTRAGVTLAALALVAGSACKKAAPPPPAPVEVPPPAPPAFGFVSADVGKAIGADKRVSQPMAKFGVHDTIYLAVETQGAAATATVTAKWTFGAAGQKVDSTSQAIAPTGPATTEFHIMKKTAWPVGKYKVEIMLDGKSVATKDFEIAK